MPVTTPVSSSTTATAVADELHVPSGVALLSIVAAPTHTESVPVISVSKTAVLTVTILVALVAPQPLVTV